MNLPRKLLSLNYDILQLEDGSWKNVGVQSVYSINDQVLKLKGLLDAEFIEVARPTVLVGEYEDWIVRKRRKDQGLRKPKMNTTKVKSKFGVLYRVTSKDIERLNTFYRDHPLALPRLDNGSQKYAASQSHNLKVRGHDIYLGKVSNPRCCSSYIRVI